MTQPFREVFSRTPHVVASAPGRVSLIGEDTDANGGYALPMAIAQRTVVELAVRRDGLVRVWSADAETEHTTREWRDHVQGVTRALREAGFRVSGFDARIDSCEPIGRGLSSSAALEVALLRALREAFDLALDDVSLAVLAQKSEHERGGAPVGILDPLASSLADEHTAVFVDTRRSSEAPTVERVPLPSCTEIAIVDSGVAHPRASGGCRLRRDECAAAARMLGVEQLRDAYRLDKIEELPEPLRRRARHVFTENARVLAAVAAMRADDPVALGGLLLESHVSMRDDFEISVPEIDALVMRAASDPMVYGARLTGRGFGGAVVVLAHEGQGRGAGERIAREVPGARVLLP